MLHSPGVYEVINVLAVLLHAAHERVADSQSGVVSVEYSAPSVDILPRQTIVAISVNESLLARCEACHQIHRVDALGHFGQGDLRNVGHLGVVVSFISSHAESGIDILSAIGLVTVNGDEVLLAVLDGIQSVVVDVNILIAGVVARHLTCQHTVYINLGVLVVVHPEAEVLQVILAQLGHLESPS